MTNSLWPGLGYGILSFIFFGLYAVPRRYTESPTPQFLLIMGITISACTSISGLLFTERLAVSFPQIVLSYVSGLLWFTGTICYIYAIDCVGVGKATPVKNLTVILGVFFGLLIFREFSWQDRLSLALLGTATLFILLSTIILGKLAPTTELAKQSCPLFLIKPRRKKTSHHTLVGFVLALAAALFYALFGVPGKMVIESMNSIWPYFIFMGQGILLGSLVFYFILAKGKDWSDVSLKDNFWGMLSGILWVLAFASLANTLKLLGMATAWPIANLNTIVTVLYSSLVLREISLRYQAKRVFAGFVLGMTGIALLAGARV